MRWWKPSTHINVVESGVHDFTSILRSSNLIRIMGNWLFYFIGITNCVIDFEKILFVDHDS